jgi:hypothetical protein
VIQVTECELQSSYSLLSLAFWFRDDQKMLDKCANADCAARLHYLRQGRIFRLGSDCAADLRVEKPTAGSEPVQYFWLCANCCRTFTLAWDSHLGVRVVPKRADLPPIKEMRVATASQTAA